MPTCSHCKGQISVYNVTYKGRDFHRGCFIRLIYKNVKDEEDRNGIFKELGISDEAVAIATNQELPVPSTLHLNDSVQLCHSDC